MVSRYIVKMCVARLLADNCERGGYLKSERMPKYETG